MIRRSVLAILLLVVLAVADAPVALAAVDTTPPTSTIKLTGTLGTNGWYKTNVAVSVTAADNVGGSGVAQIRCVVDPSSPPASFDDMPVCATVTVATEGSHVVYAASKDKAGIKESPVVTRAFKLDKTWPIVTFTVTSGTPGANGWYVSNVTVHAEGADSVSGPVTCTPIDQTQTADTSAAGRAFVATCTNSAGIATRAVSQAIKVDKTPPTVYVAVSPDRLWPPNHQLSDVAAAVDVADKLSGPGGFVLTSVTSSEPEEGLGDGDIAADIQGFAPGTADSAGQLRAERAGGGSGRVYTLIYTGTDLAGNSASASATVTVPASPAAPRKSAISQGADRVVALQRTGPGWEGTWYWYVGNTANVTNLTGATALGLLEAYRDTKDAAYLEAARAAAGFAMTHLGIGATGTQYFYRMTAPDVILLHRLAEVTGEASYASRAKAEWDNLKTYWPTAAVQDAYFKSIARRLGAWDLAAYAEAAWLAGDKAWADGAAALLANTGDSFYYGTDNPWYPMTVVGALRFLAGYGYADSYQTAMVSFLDMTMGAVSEDSVGGWIQATAYTVMALKAVGGPATGAANAMARWLAAHQGSNGGWLEGGLEYAEMDGEAVRAIAQSVGQNVALSGYRGGGTGGGAWRAGANPGKAEAFDKP